MIGQWRLLHKGADLLGGAAAQVIKASRSIARPRARGFFDEALGESGDAVPVGGGRDLA